MRILEGGLVYHVLNRGNARRDFLHKPGDYLALERILAEARQEVPMRDRKRVTGSDKLR